MKFVAGSLYKKWFGEFNFGVLLTLALYEGLMEPVYLRNLQK